MATSLALNSDSIQSDTLRTFTVLGGSDTIKRVVRNAIEAHDLLSNGIPFAALLFFKERVDIPDDKFETILGLSLRTFQRRAKDAKDLQPEQSNKLWKIAEVYGRATEILGDDELARDWLLKPAIGLENRRPVDLLSTSAGMEAVEDYLTRIEYGVYT